MKKITWRVTKSCTNRLSSFPLSSDSTLMWKRPNFLYNFILLYKRKKLVNLYNFQLYCNVRFSLVRSSQLSWVIRKSWWSCPGNIELHIYRLISSKFGYPIPLWILRRSSNIMSQFSQNEEENRSNAGKKKSLLKALKMSIIQVLVFVLSWTP